MSFRDTFQQLEHSRIQIKQVCTRIPEEKGRKKKRVGSKTNQNQKSEKREKGRKETEVVKENQRRDEERYIEG